MQDQGVDTHTAQVLAAARTGVIIVYVSKAMQRRSDRIVEAPEAIKRSDVGDAERIVAGAKLGREAGLHTAHQMPLIHTRGTLREAVSTSGEIKRYRHCHGGGERTGTARFAQPFQQHIATYRIADDGKRRATMTPANEVYNRRRISGVARMVAARQAIGCAAATAEMQQKPAIASGCQGGEHGAHIG